MRRHSSYMCPIGARRVAGVISARIGVAVSRILAAWWKREAMRRMSSQEICIGVNRLHRFRIAAGEPVFLSERSNAPGPERGIPLCETAVAGRRYLHSWSSS